MCFDTLRIWRCREAVVQRFHFWCREGQRVALAEVWLGARGRTPGLERVATRSVTARVHAWASGCVRLCDPFDSGLQAAVSMQVSRQEHCRVLPFAAPGHLFNPGSKLSPVSPAYRWSLYPPNRQGSQK